MQYPTYPDRPYAEMAALTISLWYFRDLVCELEPIGPLEILSPGEGATFTETWYLAPYEFPARRTAVQINDVAGRVQELMAQ